MKRFNPIPMGIAVLCWLCAGGIAEATVEPRQTTIVDLVGKSELILRGTITQVSDGIDANGLPYTEVSMHVAEALRGQVGSEYTFRQFGLLKPRDMGNGLTNVMTTPAGWATYRKGEESVLFLFKHAKYTGLQTTVGLSHGQFRIARATASNGTDNEGVFSHVRVDSSLLAESDRKVMSTQKGAVDAKSFVSLVRKIVDGRWIEQGSMRNEQN
jgi:hypothetical protein